MKIVVDCKSVLREFRDDAGISAIIQAIRLLVVRNPQIEWLLITDRKPSPALDWMNSNNCIQKRSLPGVLGWKFWYDRQLPAALQSLQPDVLLVASGLAARTTIPQLVWLPDWDDPSVSRRGKKYRAQFEKRIIQTLEQASGIISCSPSQMDRWKGLLEQRQPPWLFFRGEPGEQYHVLSWADKESLKTKYSGGSEYFLMVGSSWTSREILPALQAFGQFKKRQQSNMRLIIAGSLESKIEERLETYRYRKDVLILENQAIDLPKIIGAAYALINPGNSPENIFLNALASNTPVVTLATPGAKDIGGDAFLYITGNDMESIATVMMRLYKDENELSALKKKGLSRMEQLQQENQLAGILDALMAAGNDQKRKIES